MPRPKPSSQNGHPSPWIASTTPDSRPTSMVVPIVVTRKLSSGLPKPCPKLCPKETVGGQVKNTAYTQTHKLGQEFRRSRRARLIELTADGSRLCFARIAGWQNKNNYGTGTGVFPALSTNPVVGPRVLPLVRLPRVPHVLDGDGRGAVRIPILRRHDGARGRRSTGDCRWGKSLESDNEWLTLQRSKGNPLVHEVAAMVHALRWLERDMATSQAGLWVDGRVRKSGGLLGGLAGMATALVTPSLHCPLTTRRFSRHIAPTSAHQPFPDVFPPSPATSPPPWSLARPPPARPGPPDRPFKFLTVSHPKPRAHRSTVAGRAREPFRHALVGTK